MERPNIVLLILDAVRADHLSCYGHDRETTPVIDSLASEGMRFEHAFANSNWTGCSHSSIFTGLLPSHSGVYGDQLSLPTKVPTLAELLSDEGYRTFATSAGAHIRADRGYDRGFDRFDETYRIRPTGVYLGNLLSDVSTLKQILYTAFKGHDNYTYYKFDSLKKWIGDGDDPFFAFVNCKTAHHPYNPPRPYKSTFCENLQRPRFEFVERLAGALGRQPQSLPRFDADRLRDVSGEYPVIGDQFTPTAEEWEVVESWYDGAIRYLDERIGQFVDFLESTGQLDDTILLVTADHGDLFGEHDLEKHQYSLYDRLLRVPLVVRGPLVETGTCSEMVSLADLYPTILEIAGCTPPERPHATRILPWKDRQFHEYLYAEVGRKSLEPIKRRYPEYDGSAHNGPLQSIRDGQYKLIRYPDDRLELYDWRADPEESRNLVDDVPTVASSLEDRLEAELEPMKSTISDETVEDEQLQRHLENLRVSVTMTRRFLIPVMSHEMVSFAVSLGAALERRTGLPSVYICQDEYIQQAATDVIDDENLLSGYLDHEPERSLAELLSWYDITSARGLVFPQMVYDYKYTDPAHKPFVLSGVSEPEYDPYFEILHRTLDFLADVYEDGDGGIPIQFQGAEVLRRSVQRAADQHEVPSIWVGYSPIEGTSGLYTDEQMDWRSFERAEYDFLSAEERRRAEEFVEQFHEDREIESHGLGSGGESSSVGAIADDGGGVLGDLQGKLSSIRQYGTDVPPIAINWLRRNVGRKLSARYADRKYLPEDESRAHIDCSEFVFYPIQYYRESRIAVRAKPYYNQSWFVEYLSRSVPYDCDLVIKDHPQHLGAQPRSAVQTFCRHAIAIDPQLPPHDIIERAAAVVTLNNTGGYEAILHGKPVVTMGDAFYSGHGYTMSVDGIDDIDGTVRRAVDSGGLDHEEVVEFAHGLIEGSFPGEWAVDEDRNVAALAESILDYAEQELDRSF